MNAFDTLKIKFAKDLLEYPHEYHDLFDRSERTTSGTGEVRTTYSLCSQERRNIIGLGELSYDDSGGAIITLSAKVLGKDYFRGINRYTIEQAIHNVLPKWISTDTSELLSSANVLKVDVTENVPCDNVERALIALEQWQHDTKGYHATRYGRGRVSGIEWRSALKTDNIRLVAYDKVRELQTPSQRSKAYALGIDQFRGTVRLELNVRSFKSIRSLFALEKGVPRLPDILDSQERVLFRGYNAVLPERQRKVTMDNTRTFSEFRNQLAYEHIFELCAWEWKVIEHTIRSKYGKRSNPYRRLSEAKDYYHTMKRDRDQVRTGEVERIRGYLGAV